MQSTRTDDTRPSQAAREEMQPLALKCRPIVVTGVPRVGKSILAQRIAKATGRALLQTDSLRREFWAYTEPGKRLAKRHACFARHLSAHDGHAVMEGVDLMRGDHAADKLVRQGIASIDASPDLRHALAVRSATGAHLFALGYPEIDVAAKMRAVRSYRRDPPCWTARLSDAALEHSVLAWIEMNDTLRERAEAASVPFLEIGADSFESDLERAIGAILRTADESAA